MNIFSIILYSRIEHACNFEISSMTKLSAGVEDPVVDLQSLRQAHDLVWPLQLYELCHHYNELSGAAKVDVHVMATVIARCLSCSTVNSAEKTVGDIAAKV